MGRPTLSSVLFLFFISALAGTVTSQVNKRIVCYYGSWTASNPNSLQPENIDPYACTHIIYAFANINDSIGIIPGDVELDINQKGYKRIVSLKNGNPDLKVLIGIGGLTEGSIQFSRITGDLNKRTILVKSIVKFVREHGFDGVDLDWQFPAFRGGAPHDKESYALLVKELKRKFLEEARTSRTERLLLTMVVPNVPEYVRKGYKLLELNSAVDFMNMIGYDFHWSDEPDTEHHAPLYPIPGDEINQENNIDHLINLYLRQGMYPWKLTLGIPAYGRVYQLADPNKNDFNAPAGGEGSEAAWSYSTICSKISKEVGWTVKRPYPRETGPYAYKDSTWVSYDDPQSVSVKARYASDWKLAGIMFWSLDHMDHKGECGMGTYPLIRAAKEALGINWDNTLKGNATTTPSA